MFSYPPNPVFTPIFLKIAVCVDYLQASYILRLCLLTKQGNTLY